MKSIIVKKIQEEYGIRYIGSVKLSKINFYDLCGYYKRLKKWRKFEINTCIKF